MQMSRCRCYYVLRGCSESSAFCVLSVHCCTACPVLILYLLQLSGASEVGDWSVHELCDGPPESQLPGRQLGLPSSKSTWKLTEGHSMKDVSTLKRGLWPTWRSVRFRVLCLGFRLQRSEPQKQYALLSSLTLLLPSCQNGWRFNTLKAQKLSALAKDWTLVQLTLLCEARKLSAVVFTSSCTLGIRDHCINSFCPKDPSPHVHGTRTAFRLGD